MGSNIRTQRLLTCLFSIRLFLDAGLLPLANGVSALRYNVLFLNRLQYSLGFIAAPPLSPGKGGRFPPCGFGRGKPWVWIAVAVGCRGKNGPQLIVVTGAEWIARY